MRFGIAVVVGLGLLGCAERAPAQAAGSGADTLVVTSDPELRELAVSLLPDLAARSGLELRAPVRLERRSRVELEAYVVSKLDEELPPERAALLSEAYSLLGLVPPDFDMRRTLVEVYTEQVAGFYDPDSTTLYVMDDQPRSSLESVLVHELVHAVQDQWVDLAAATAPELDNDRRSAAQAAIEGHATLVMLEQLLGETGAEVDVVEMPELMGQLRPSLGGLGDQYPALSGAPRVVQELLLLPYLSGTGFIQSVWVARGGRTPLGEILPASTEQVAYPARYLADPPDAPTRVTLEIAEPATALLDDVLGFAETRILLEELAGEEAGAGAEGWDGDRWVLVEQGGARGVVWVAVFDDTPARDRFVDLLRPALGALPARATLGAMTVDARPVAMLRVGIRPEVTVRLEGGGP